MRRFAHLAASDKTLCDGASLRVECWNDDVVALLTAGLSPTVVVAKVETSRSHFDMSPDALVKLREQRVPDSVLLAMVQADAKSHDAAATPATGSGGVDTDGKIRVFVTDSQSWSTSGYGWLHGGEGGVNGGSASRGPSRPQTVEIIKTIGQRCPDLLVTNQPERANFVLTLDHEGGKGYLRVRNKVAVFD